MTGRSTHGHTRGRRYSPEYESWMAMLNRCYNEKQSKYRYYGGRGITVCDRWRTSFEDFLADMGPRPAGTTLDRYPNRDGHYEPGNCRWATAEEQASNRSNVTPLTFQGQTKTVAAWARETGVGYRVLRARLAAGWPVDKALTVQPSPSNSRIGLSAAERARHASV